MGLGFRGNISVGAGATTSTKASSKSNPGARTGANLYTVTGAIPQQLQYDPEEDRSWLESDLPYNIDGEDDDDRQNDPDAAVSDFFQPSEYRPIWLLHDGQLLWASRDFGINTAPRQQFKILLQSLLDCLKDLSLCADDTERLRLLFHFFKAKEEQTSGEADDLQEPNDNVAQGADDKESDEKSTTGWLDSYSFDREGIQCGDDVIPLKSFMVGRGNSTMRLEVMKTWLDREFIQHPGKDPLSWRRCKKWLPESLNRLDEQLEKACRIEVPGLKPFEKVDYSTKESLNTLQKNHVYNLRKSEWYRQYCSDAKED